MKNRHRHAIEQASRRWRGGRRDDSARRRRKMLISTRASTTAESSRLSFVKSNFDRPSTFTWLSTSTYTSVSSIISSPVRKSTSASGAHKVISRRQRSRAAESIDESPHRHAIELASRRWRGGRRMTPRRRPGPAAADDEARNHQRGVPRHTNDVGATPGVPRPRPTIVRHAAPPCSNFHQTSRNAAPTRSEFTQNRIKNHPAP